MTLPNSRSPVPPGRFLVARSGDALFARVIGPGTMNNSIAFKEFLEHEQNEGARRFLFDLSECSGFDSTFMGIMIGLTFGPGRVVVVNPRPPHVRLLSEVGIDRVAEICAEPVAVPELELREIEVCSLDPRTRVRHVVAAHEDLVRLDPGNRERFGAFLDLVRRELGEDAPP